MVALYSRVRGDGPLVLLLQGGDGRSEGTDGLVEQLQDRFTLLSYDRRGLVRSPDDPGVASDPDTRLQQHADDAAGLLDAHTDRPAVVFGTSIGAVIGLELLTRHPDRVSLLVAHEPPAVDLLPHDERAAAAAQQERIEAASVAGGAFAAMRQFLVATGIDPTDAEPDVRLGPPASDRLTDVETFLRHDAPAVARYRPDRAALQALADRIVPAVGENSARLFPGRCAQALGELLERPVERFPGGHSGFALRPRGFAARLAEVLAGAPTTR